MRAVYRTAVVVVATMAAFSAVSVAAAWAASASQPPLKTVTYLGFKVGVPASWPVINLASRPATCVRFDRHAVYLGVPGSREACPAHLIAPHTGALLIQPMLQAGPKTGVGEDRESEVITAADPAGGILVTATYGQADKGLVESIIGHAHLPATRAPGNPAPPQRALMAPAASAQIAGAGPAGPTSFTGKGFDTCAAPASSLMPKAMSAYGPAIGIYIGGSTRACAQPNLTASWVSTQASAGWHFIPLYAGPQASSSLTASQGAQAADDAMQQAQSLGFGAGNPIYYDMEAFQCSCNSQVTAFLSGWTGELHDYGYLSGVYGSGASTISAEVADYGNTSDRRPDIIDYSTDDGQANVNFSGLSSPVPGSYWANHQRINQYTLNVSCTLLGECIDNDYMDAIIAASPDSALDSMFNTAGDGATCADWSGGDATNSVALPSGDRAWFFSDTYLGAPADRKSLFFTSSLHNSIMLQQGGSLTKTITGGNTCQEHNTSLPFLSRYAKTPAVPPDASGPPAAWFWTGDQMLVNSNVVKFYYHVHAVQPDSFAIDYPAVATIPASSLENDSVLNITPTQVSCGPGNIIWGTSLLNWQGNVYVYGFDAPGGALGDSVYLAKTTAAGLTDPATWSLYDGLDSSGHPMWTASLTGCPQSAAPLPITGTTGFSVTTIPGSSSLWAIQFDYTNGQLNASGAIAAHPATTPWGFSNTSVPLYYPPQGHVTYPDYYQVYEARIQPGLGGTGTVVISYNVNTSAVDTGCISANVHDASIYRPRFVDISTSAFNAAAAGPAPAVLMRGAATGRAVPASGIRDSRLASQVPPPAARDARAAAAAAGPIDNANDWFYKPLGGNCPAINAPTSLHASTPTADGLVTLSWTQPPTGSATTVTDVWYYAYDCDKTATGCPSLSSSGGYKKEWGGLWATTTSGVVAPVTNLDTQFDNPSGHLIDFYVQSFGAGNGSGGGNSNVAEETVTVQRPSAPTGLAVAGNSGGQVNLTWNQVTYPSTAVFYTVYDCDQTTTTGGCGAPPTATSGPSGGWGQPNGNTGGLTGTSATVPSLTPGNRYEFCVQAANLGGNSNCSAVVSVTVAG